MLEHLPISDWLHRFGEFALSREVLQDLVLQLGLIGALFALAWGVRLAIRGITDRLAERLARIFPAARRAAGLRPLATIAIAWLLLVIARRMGAHYFWLDLRLVGIAASLSAVWMILRASTLLFRDAALARLVATLVWIIAALDITGLLTPTAAALDSAALTIGTLRLSPLLVIKAVLLITLLLWAALALAQLIGSRIQHFAGLSPSLQTLARNLINIALVFLALVIGLNTVGIDLTAFAVFSGAIGVGLGFGLQKIVSNFVSGIILLIEESIKPGDVIEVGHTYGSVTALGARYTSVRGRDSKEYLIPNETLITNQVVNWSYSSPLLRLDIPFGVSYQSDLREVRRVAIAAAGQVKRVLGTPPPVCHVTEFGESAINLLLRFWIEDPANGVVNIKGDVHLALWDAFREHGIEIPCPQRDIRIRELPPGLFRAAPAPARSAAE